MLKKFEQVATRSSFVDYYGELDGRYEHRGYAVGCDLNMMYA